MTDIKAENAYIDAQDLETILDLHDMTEFTMPLLLTGDLDSFLIDVYDDMEPKDKHDLQIDAINDELVVLRGLERKVYDYLMIAIRPDIDRILAEEQDDPRDEVG